MQSYLLCDSGLQSSLWADSPAAMKVYFIIDAILTSGDSLSLEQHVMQHSVIDVMMINDTCLKGHCACFLHVWWWCLTHSGSRLFPLDLHNERKVNFLFNFTTDIKWLILLSELDRLSPITFRRCKEWPQITKQLFWAWKLKLFLFFTLLTVICYGCFLVANVLIVSHWTKASAKCPESKCKCCGPDLAHTEYNSVMIKYFCRSIFGFM